MYCQRAFSGFATMVCSATGTVWKTWPAAENSSAFRLLWHHHHRTIASATDNSLDRICCNARSARKVRCGGPVFSRRAPQPPHGTVHEAMLPAMPLLAEASLSPRSAQKSVSTRFRQPKECPYRSADTVFLGFPHCKTHPARFSQLNSFPSRFRSPLPLQYCDLSKHIARGMLQRLSTTGF